MTRSAFITGAATGIGNALVRKLDSEGWRCFAGYNRQSPDALLSECSERTVAVQCNVADDASVSEGFTTIANALGDTPLDLLVNNAATTGGAGGGIESIDIDRFKALFEVNFWGPIRVTQAALPLIRKSDNGRIINVGSASQYLTIPIGSSYPVTKAALQRMTQALRLELRPFGIGVTCLEPGGVETPMMDITDAQKEELWASFPDHLLEPYQQHFQFPGDAIESTFRVWTADKFAEKVYRDVITTRRLKPNYLIGPGVQVLPVLQRALPTATRERIFERMFRRKK